MNSIIYIILSTLKIGIESTTTITKKINVISNYLESDRKFLRSLRKG